MNIKESSTKQQFLHEDLQKALSRCQLLLLFLTLTFLMLREEADSLFACLETSSEAATPRASEAGPSPAHTPAPSSSGLKRLMEPSPGGSQQLSVGSVDEANFPALGASSMSKVGAQASGMATTLSQELSNKRERDRERGGFRACCKQEVQ